MMYERGKSDIAIVAVKPANKAEQSAAEQVEPRAVTKGNADQRSTSRAQSRTGVEDETVTVDVSQALERIREGAKEKRTEMFITLLNYVDADLLEEELSQLRDYCGPELDGITCEESV